MKFGPSKHPSTNTASPMVRAAPVTMARFTLIAHVLFLLQLRSLAIAWKPLRFLIYFSPAYCAVRIVVIRFSPQRFRRFDCAPIFRRIADAYTPPTSPMQSGDDILKCYGWSQQPRRSLRRLSSISVGRIVFNAKPAETDFTDNCHIHRSRRVKILCLHEPNESIGVGGNCPRRAQVTLRCQADTDGFDRVRFLSENPFRRNPNKPEQHSINLQGSWEG